MKIPAQTVKSPICQKKLNTCLCVFVKISQFLIKKIYQYLPSHAFYSASFLRTFLMICYMSVKFKGTLSHTKNFAVDLVNIVTD